MAKIVNGTMVFDDNDTMSFTSSGGSSHTIYWNDVLDKFLFDDKGGSELSVVVASSAYTIGTGDISEAYGGVIYTSSTGDVTLPEVEVGMSVTVIGTGSVVVTVAPDGTDKILLDGVDATAGVTVVSLGLLNDTIILTYYSSGTWHASSNFWTIGS